MTARAFAQHPPRLLRLIVQSRAAPPAARTQPPSAAGCQCRRCAPCATLKSAAGAAEWWRCKRRSAAGTLARGASPGLLAFSTALVLVIVAAPLRPPTIALRRCVRVCARRRTLQPGPRLARGGRRGGYFRIRLAVVTARSCESYWCSLSPVLNALSRARAPRLSSCGVAPGAQWRFCRPLFL